MYIKIKPHSSLFFRDGKPFIAGENSWANTSILPNPSVLWGAICSMLMTEGCDIESLENNLQLEKIYLYNEDSKRCFWPAPQDIFVNETGEILYEKYEKYEKQENIVTSTNLPCFVFPDTDEKVEKADNLFMDISSICHEYTHYNSSPSVITTGDIRVDDHKVGITRDRKTRTSEEHKLYRIDLVQFKENWSFLVKVECQSGFPANLTRGFLKLGGEGKAAEYEVINEEPHYIKNYNYDKEILLKEKRENKYLKLYLTSHALFDKGWIPLEGAFAGNGYGLKLTAASVGKPLFIGGFDIKKRMPKPMRKAVPAGSVYVFEIDRKNEIILKDIADDFIKKFSSSLEQRGFGAFEIVPL
jgi:CRISPR-associated protein Cmr3